MEIIGKNQEVSVWIFHGDCGLLLLVKVSAELKDADV